jgi:hypothetical protein
MERGRNTPYKDGGTVPDVLHRFAFCNIFLSRYRHKPEYGGL